MNLLPITGDLVRALGWSILHALWQAFFVYACLRVVLKLWPMASARIKYNLSFFALSGIFTWFLITFYQQWQTISAAKQLLVQYVPADAADLSALAVQPAAPYASQLTMVTLFPSLEQCFPVLVTLYLAGMLLMTIKLSSDLVQLHHIRTSMVEPMGEVWEKHLQRLMGRLKLSRPVKLLVSRYIQVPVMLGFLKPVILLPVAMVNNLSEEQLEAILLHELAHVKRNDYLLNIFQSIVETILFFNPFVWLISRIIRQEREHCCDDLVIAGTVQPLHYAKALMALETYRLTSNPMAMAAADDKQHLFHRIKRIMEMKTKHLNYSQKLLAVLIIATALVSIAWLNPARGKDAGTKLQETAMAADTSVPAMPTPPSPPAPPPATPQTPPEPQAADEIPEAPEPPPAPIAPEPPIPANIQTPQNVIVMNSKGQMIHPPMPPMAPMAPVWDSVPQKHTRQSEAAVRKQLQLAQQSVEKAMQQLKEIDVKKIQAEAQAAVDQVDWKAIAQEAQAAQEAAREALKSIDWSQMQQDIKNSMNFQFDFDNEAWKKNSEKFRKESEKFRKEWDANRKKMDADRSRQLKEMSRMRDQSAAANRQQLFAMRDSSLSRQRQRQQHLDEQRDRMLRQTEDARHEADKARRSAEVAREKATATSQKYREMIDKMAADKLIDNQQSFTIEKNANGLFINGVKQSDSVAEKYGSYLKNKRTYIRQAEPGNLNINIED
ncbi:M48 family metalloprotease [Chitinophaga oryzae]|uniref:M48 family metalloprotease n=1 Tax=Chitinophaga oryzae TaxID=2725414 RepID=A0AAE6ZHB7_9BACT|nr:M56 family metallopeptidase [Chitinophaga oryzae]QJB32736.1 M48 family metalloprotease [Chitinophaga oryzae]QJB39188.1 M48 family metalloprotease [Chitinophaga oryzae]